LITASSMWRMQYTSF